MDTKTSDSRRKRRLGILGLLAVSAFLTLGSGASTLALFTASKSPTAAFTTGTIDLTTSPSTIFTATAVMPGDSGSQTLAVTNSGTGQLR